MFDVKIKKGDASMTLSVRSFKEELPLQDLLCELERNILGSYLAFNGGNKARTAKNLKLNRTTLVEKARKYGFPIKTKC